MVKLFIGNLPDGGSVTNDMVRPLFEAYGVVTECEVIKNYGWVPGRLVLVVVHHNDQHDYFHDYYHHYYHQL